MVVGDELFTSASGHSKLQQRDRHLYLDEMASVLSDPDEIYLESQQLRSGKVRIVKKMMRYFKDEAQHTKAIQAVFSYEQGQNPRGEFVRDRRYTQYRKQAKRPIGLSKR